MKPISLSGQLFRCFWTWLYVSQSRYHSRFGSEFSVKAPGSPARRNFLEENRKKTKVSLQESVRRQEREATKQRFLDMENTRRKAKGLQLYKDYAELEAAQENEDSEKPTDSLLQETADILIDWLLFAQKQLALH